ncbi:protein arginine methyltransferase NDUFAF7, mitochondrial-like [Mya arenaria]|uniref:protein arginine methyltransferase NDUFAF7, mitochondrial-like n=1 Tax=Mya arenaria TaxID=6604 RepID=UPI0022E40291|nr:protein arginine methyltransferase NDUFAF7, mitochondrial-like [Mya arenaria]
MNSAKLIQRFMTCYSRRRCLSYSMLHQKKQFCTKPDNKLMTQLQSKINFSGPITVAEYMKEALTHATEGYYIHSDVFGVAGDFITSPEISQMFGELIAIWFVNEWMMIGAPENVQLVEMGPGRGTMADDMLRAFSKFPELSKALSVHLVEVSVTLSRLQEEKLSATPDQPAPSSKEGELHYKSCLSKYGPCVYWYRDIKDVPAGCNMFVAHEFFDALPIHKFQKTEHGWREVLVDIDPETENKLRFVLARGDTPASKLALKLCDGDDREHVEVCPQAALVMNYLASCIQEHGGCALIADYGHHGDKQDTFRGFKDHALHEVLENPGCADLTSDVDFSYLKQHTDGKVKAYGPVTQSLFLQNLGIAYRLKILYDKADESGKADLLSAFKLLTYPEEMGERFKFLALLNNACQHNPVGFEPLPEDQPAQPTSEPT